MRGEIDRLDQNLVSLLNHRAEVVSQIGQVKHAGLEVWSAARERGDRPGPGFQHRTASSGDAQDHFSRADERLAGVPRAMRVSYLGPKYSYSHLASVAKFGESVEHVPVASISAVFEEVNRRHVQFGLVPLENSTDGRVADTLDMFIKLPNLKIRAEVKLRV